MFISWAILFMQCTSICPYAYGVLIPLFTIITFTVIIAVFILLPLLLFYCCHQITVTTDKLLREKSFSGVVELTTQLLRLINILWLPLCRISKLGLYCPRRLLRSPTLVGHQPSSQTLVQWWFWSSSRNSAGGEIDPGGLFIAMPSSGMMCELSHLGLRVHGSS